MRCEVIPDWLSFTLRGKEPHEVIRDVLGMDVALFEKLPYTWQGYQDVVEYQNIRVASNGREDEHFSNMGVCVSITGNGCRTFETLSHLGPASEEGGFSVNFMRLFEYLDKDETVNVTRLDMAADDRDGLLEREDIIDRYLQDGIRTRTTKWDLIIGKKNKVKGGFTLYIGSRSSEFFTKIYDKEAEMKQNKLVDTGHWIRVETTLKHKNAESFIHLLVQGQEVGQLMAEVLNDKFSFINLDDSNITRCSVCDWWEEFVSEVQKVRLVTRRAVQHSVSQIAEWVKTQISPSLYILSKTLGYSVLREIIEGASERIEDDERKMAIIRDYHIKSEAGRRVVLESDVVKEKAERLKFQEEREKEEWRQAREYIERYSEDKCYIRAMQREAYKAKEALSPGCRYKIEVLLKKYHVCVPAFNAEPIASFG